MISEAGSSIQDREHFHVRMAPQSACQHFAKFHSPGCAIQGKQDMPAQCMKSWAHSAELWVCSGKASTMLTRSERTLGCDCCHAQCDRGVWSQRRPKRRLRVVSAGRKLAFEQPWRLLLLCASIVEMSSLKTQSSAGSGQLSLWWADVMLCLDGAA